MKERNVPTYFCRRASRIHIVFFYYCALHVIQKFIVTILPIALVGIFSTSVIASIGKVVLPHLISETKTPNKQVDLGFLTEHPIFLLTVDRFLDTISDSKSRKYGVCVCPRYMYICVCVCVCACVCVWQRERERERYRD